MRVQDAAVVLNITLQVRQHVWYICEQSVVNCASCQEAQRHCASAGTKLKTCQPWQRYDCLLRINLLLQLLRILLQRQTGSAVLLFCLRYAWLLLLQRMLLHVVFLLRGLC
jgi:hypothetical protein